MNSRKSRVIAGITIAVFLCWLSAPFWGRGGGANPVVSRAPLSFDGDEAFRITRDFVTRNPTRVLGSITSRQATGFLQDELGHLGYQVSFAHFDAIIAGHREVGRNVLAYREGDLPGILVLVAHYDTAPTTVQGATDDGAGVGVSLELARVFSQSPLRHSLVILLSDGEEYGMLGAADFAANYPERARLAAALSLDGVSTGALAGFTLNIIGQRRGVSPSWLRRLSAAAAGSLGLPVASPSGITEDMQRSLYLSRTDQGPFLGAGIPAINLGSIAADEGKALAVYHSESDTIANLDPTSVDQFGKAAERIVRSLDELPAFPGANGDFRWSGDIFLSGRVMTILQFLAFLPLAAMLASGWFRPGGSLRFEGILREFSFFLAWLLPAALIYSLILFCRLMRLVPQYSLYPGPVHDPALAAADWRVVAGILAAAAVTWAGLHAMTWFLARGRQRSFASARMLLMTLLLVVVVLALRYNPFWAVSFLVFPSLVWGAVGRGRSAGTRALAALAVIAAGFVFYAVVIFAAGSLGLGAGLLWYAILGLSSGMLQWQGYFLGACAIVIGLRFLALQFGTVKEIPER